MSEASGLPSEQRERSSESRQGRDGRPSFSPVFDVPQGYPDRFPGGGVGFGGRGNRGALFCVKE